MLNNLVVKMYLKVTDLLECKKGASSELLSAVGLIAIAVGIIGAVGPLLEARIESMVTNVLSAASAIFTLNWGTPAP